MNATERALLVIVRTPEIREYLRLTDPKALEQAVNALRASDAAPMVPAVEDEIRPPLTPYGIDRLWRAVSGTIAQQVDRLLAEDDARYAAAVNATDALSETKKVTP